MEVYVKPLVKRIKMRYNFIDYSVKRLLTARMLAYTTIITNF
ncbi:hypothetical protein SAMN04488008_1133 [Maribacter orientalis]|uniref:Uncharacterized protein n=1 Tax=Maribacter orientalis TaxID=228957 RepID=A0A1H7WSE5_9FLAO|nr:hypothetical protein SAMN04488008_1133 [Maribacter orientalis]